MRNKLILLFVLFFSQAVLAQNYHEQFIELNKDKDVEGQVELLAEWEKSNPDDPELFTSYFNYFYSQSQKEILTLGTESSGGLSLQLLDDSTGEVAGYLYGDIHINPEMLEKAFMWIDKGIKKFPNRLDMRFGKTYALGQLENWDGFTDEIIRAVDYSVVNKNEWTWTNNESVEDPKNFLLGNVQGYLMQIYDTQDDSLLIYMRKVSERVLVHYPNHVESLSNVSITYILLGEYEKALPPLLKAEKTDPKDDIVLCNIAQAYKLMEDEKNSIKYYKKAIKYGDAQTVEFAERQIEELKAKD